jgi:ribosomal protein L35AE/L33A
MRKRVTGKIIRKHGRTGAVCSRKHEGTIRREYKTDT